MNTRVAVIEEDPLEREYLLALMDGAPGLTVSAAYNKVPEALQDMADLRPDLVLVDLDAQSPSDVEWLGRLHAQLPQSALLVLSAEEGSEPFFKALEAGVSGWLQKPCTADQIVRAIRVLREGGAVLSSHAAGIVLDYFHARGASLECLSLRELQIMRLLSQGCGADNIAANIGVTKETLRTHFSNILEKMQVNSRAEAVAKYLNPPR